MAVKVIVHVECQLTRLPRLGRRGMHKSVAVHKSAAFHGPFASCRRRLRLGQAVTKSSTHLSKASHIILTNCKHFKAHTRPTFAHSGFFSNGLLDWVSDVNPPAQDFRAQDLPI
jgi:hypothetical protein